MNTLSSRPAAVQPRVIFNANRPTRRTRTFAAGLLSPDAEYRTLCPPDAPSDREARVRFLDSTFSAEENRIARRFGIELPEARDLLAEGADAIQTAEWDRMAVLEDMEAACEDHRADRMAEDSMMMQSLYA